MRDPRSRTPKHMHWVPVLLANVGLARGARPDKSGAIFRPESAIHTAQGYTRMVLIADLRDRYADLRRTLSRHLKRLYDAGHVIFVSHSAVLSPDSRAYWRYREQLYPGLTQRKLMTRYLKHHAAEFAKQGEFYEAQKESCV